MSRVKNNLAYGAAQSPPPKTLVPSAEPRWFHRTAWLALFVVGHVLEQPPQFAGLRSTARNCLESVRETVRLGSATAGLDMSAVGWTQQELVQMVAHAQAPIILRDVGDRSIDDLAQIAASGKGHVIDPLGSGGHLVRLGRE